MSKRSRISKEEDDLRIITSKKSRISDDVLPVELIHHIQSLLPLKDGGRTCILSKSWRRAWYTLPTLNLLPPVEEPDQRLDHETETKYNHLIHTTLQRYHVNNTPIQSFSLQLNIIENKLRNVDDVQNWIRLVVSNTCLKHLSLDIQVLLRDGDDPHLSLALPNELFSSQALHTIHLTAATSESLTNLRLRIPSTNLINCGLSLRVLDLDCIFINQDVLNNLLSTCKLLEKITLVWCGGLKNVKLQNLLRLTHLDILTNQDDDLWDINNVPSLSFFRYRHLSASSRPLPFQLDSLAGVTHLWIAGGFIFNHPFFHALGRNFTVLESLTLVIEDPVLQDLVLTSSSLKWLTLNIYPSGPVLSLQVYAPKLLSFIYTGRIPGLHFQTPPPKQVELTFDSWEETFGPSYFLRVREALNSSSNFDIKIKSSSLDSLVPCFNIDVDDLRRRVFLSPVGNVELELETRLDEHAWEQSQFFNALFLICHPSYIRSSYQVIRKMMEGNTTHELKQVLLKNPHNGNWEALTTTWKNVLHTLDGHLECKLIWSAQ